MCDEDRFKENIADDKRLAAARAVEEGWPVRIGTRVRRLAPSTRFCSEGSTGTVVQLCLREKDHEFGTDFRVNWDHATYLNDDGYELSDLGQIIEVVS